jgi:hypothetical protein
MLPRYALLSVCIALFSSRSVAAAEPIAGVTAKATSAQVKPLFAAQNVCTDKGMKPAEGIPESSRLTTNIYAEGGNCWHSGYLELGADERPLIEFDLGKTYTVEKFHVWNYNGAPHRGFREVSLDYSVDGKKWQSWPVRFTFKMAPKSDDYLGEEYALSQAIRARHIRFFCESTHRSGGQPDLAGLGKVRFYATKKSVTPAAVKPTELFPVGSGVIDVQAAPYFAKGDGKTDDTVALQRAIDELQGRHQTIYLRAGTYLVSKSLRFKPAVGNGYNTFRGAGAKQTIMRLKDSTFVAAEKPQPILSLGFNGQEDGKGVHADWFNNNVFDLTFDCGRGNPGAIGLQYYSNNVGALRDVEIRSGDGTGTIGLDLGYADQNGPCLVKNVTIDGFSQGIRTGATVNSQTLENIRITGASKIGWENAGQCLSIQNLFVEASGPAFVNKVGVVALINAELVGKEIPADTAAITSHETLFARNIKTSGYASAINNRREKDSPTGDAAWPNVDEWVSTPPLSLFPQMERRSLNLPIQDTPEVTWDDPSEWANVRHFRDVKDPDDTAAVQRAIDSGATTVFFPAGGHYFISETVVIRGPVRRIIGLFSWLHPVKSVEPMFRMADGQSPVVVFQDFAGDAQIEHSGNRTLVIRNGQGMGGKMTGQGELYLENVVADWEFRSGRVWARQFNNERLGTHILNAGATLWILGLKTERGGTLIETKAGGVTELLGGLSYTTNNGKLAPMFVSENARVSYVIGEVCYTGDPYKFLVKETRNGVERVLSRGDAPLRPLFLQGSQIPLYTSAAD